MILRFCFARTCANLVLETVLDEILEKISQHTNFSYSIQSEEKSLDLFLQAKQEELESISDEFARLLPVSLFYSFEKVDVVQLMPDDTQKLSQKVALPFTLCALEEFLAKANLDDKAMQKLIKQLQDGEFVDFDGKSIGLVGKAKCPSGDFVITPSDLSLVPRMVSIQDEELKALASLEKPVLECKINLIYKAKKILDVDFVDIRLSDTVQMYALCKALFDLGKEYLFVVDKSEKLRVNILENNAVVMLNNSKYASKKELAKLSQKAHERFSSVIYEYDLFKQKNLGFFLSKKHDDFAMSYCEKTGLEELIRVKLPSSFEELLQSIEQSENGKKLLQNYKNVHGDLLEHALSLSIDESLPKNFYSLLGLAGVLLGYGKSIEEASFNVFENAKRFSHTKGVRIDVKLEDENFPSHINLARFIQSGLSFRLAGVEPQTLCFGYLESIAYFISDMSDLIAKTYDSENISLTGELFSYKRLLETAAKNIQPNHKLYINKAFSIE